MRHQLENTNRQLVVATESHRRRIHHADTIREKAVERHLAEHRGVGKAHGIPIVDPLHLRGLEQDIRVDLHRAQRSGRVGRKIRVARAGGEDHDAPTLEVADGTPPDIRLCHLPYLYRRLYACRHARALERILHRESIHDRREHPHVVALRSIHPDAGAFEPAEDIAAADHDPNLHAEAMDLRELGSGRAQGAHADAEAPLPAKSLATQLEHDALVFELRMRSRRGHREIRLVVPAGRDVAHWAGV